MLGTLKKSTINAVLRTVLEKGAESIHHLEIPRMFDFWIIYLNVKSLPDVRCDPVVYDEFGSRDQK